MVASKAPATTSSATPAAVDCMERMTRSGDPMLDIAAETTAAPTRTHALLAGSAAIDPLASLSPPSIDQRGESRDGFADLGAYEFVSVPINVTGRETVDDDSDGQIDYIKITTDANLNDDFSGLSMSVAGYTLDVTTPYVTNIDAGGDNDNVFYVMLQESGSADTGATPLVTIVANTTLGQFGGGANVDVDSSGVAATDNAGAVLISATSTQVIGTTIFQVGWSPVGPGFQ